MITSRLNQAICTLALGVCTMVPAHAYSDLVIFGDSLSDTGNVGLALQAAGFANASLGYPQPVTNSYIPSAPYPITGAYFPAVFSNGPVWATDFAAALGLSATASLLPGAGGTNYAFAGARVTKGLAQGQDVPSLIEQYGMYLLGMGPVKADALYVVAGGGNDARDILAALPTSSNAAKTIGDGAISFAMGVDFIVEGLQAAGARNILVWDVPNLGITPAVRAMGDAAIDAGMATSFAMSSALNAMLADDPDVMRLSVFGLTSMVAANPAAFGFANATDACGGAAAGTDCDTYFFWDGIHPTAQAHRLLADRMIAVAVPEPETYALMALGLVAVGFAARRRRQPQA